MFYNLKELEVLGKKHGVIPQAVKEVVDCLVAERIVVQEKIGSLNMYDMNWSFPTLAPRFWCFGGSNTESVGMKVESQRGRLKEIRSEIERLTTSDSSPDISEDELLIISNRVSDLELKLSGLAAQLNKLLRSDPATIKKLSESIGEVKRCANIATENVFILRQFLVRRFGAFEEDINKEFGIPADFDTL